MNPTIPTQKQQTLAPVSASQSVDPLASGLYWNKSRWNGRKAVPVVLELTGDKLTMYNSDDSPVFSAPLTAVQARFTRSESLHLIVNGTPYWLAGMGTVSPSFSASQKQRLQEFNKSVALTRGAIGATGAGIIAGAMNNPVVGGVGDAAGAAMELLSLHDADALLNKWYTALQQAGVQVTGKRAGMMKYTLVVLGLILICFIYLAVTHPSHQP